MKLRKLVISCGGTGGHFYPGLSVARTFKAQGGEVCLLLSGIHAVSQQQIAAAYGITAFALPEMPHYSRRPLRFLVGFFRGYRQTVKILRESGAQAMLGMGSFAGLPVILAAVHQKLPLFLHDGNARIGKANRFFSRWAKFAATAFPAVNAQECRCPVLETGMPVRPELLALTTLSKEDAVTAVNREFGTVFQASKPLILVTGGSQGAAIFNQVLPEAFCRCNDEFQVIHLTGKGKLEETAIRYSKAVFPFKLMESSGKMGELLAAADLVFSRSGGSTSAELALFGKAGVLVPYPFAAEGHQLDNARHFVQKGAAVLVENRELDVDKCCSLIQNFLEEPAKWRRIGKNMLSLSRPDASDELLRKISDGLD